MGLYDDRLADLSEPRRRRVAQRRMSPMLRPRPAAGRPPVVERPYPPSVGREARRPSTDVQSLLFERDAGWTPSKAKVWAKSHGYKSGKVDITDQYVRLRQFDPKGFKVKRTIPFGRGIRAVVAREGTSMITQEARRSRRRSKKAPGKRRRRVARATAAPKRRRRRARTTAAAPKRRRTRARVSAPRRRRRAAPPMVMEAPRKRRRKSRRKARRVRAVDAWRGNPAGHRKAAKKGWRRRKKSRRVRETPVMAEARRRPRRRRKSSRRAREYNYTMEARRPRRRRMNAARGQRGSQMMHLAIATLTGGVGYVLADGLDRFLATYDPAATEKPKDKFTSDGAGTLANTLNVASPPGWARIGAGVGAVAVPAIGAAFVQNKYAQCALEGAAIGAGVSLFKTLWNNLLMPALKGKDTTTAALQKSYIARLYPAEVSAAINREQKPPQTAVSSTGSGALSGAADVGPFALAADSPYPNAAEALRAAAGVQGPGGDYPTQQQVWGTGGEEYPTAAQVMGTGAPAGVGAWAPGPPPGTGPGPQERTEDKECACLGDGDQFLGFIGDPESKETSPFLTS